MGKLDAIKKINLSGKKVWKLVIIFIIVAAVVAAGLLLFKGDTKVEYVVLKDTEVPAQIASQVIPEYRQLERALACIVDDKIYVLASRGAKPTSGYEIAIEKMSWSEENGKSVLTVYCQFKDPKPGAALTQAVTYPLQVAETNLDALPDQIELRVQYVE